MKAKVNFKFLFPLIVLSQIYIRPAGADAQSHDQGGDCQTTVEIAPEAGDSNAGGRVSFSNLSSALAGYRTAGKHGLICVSVPSARYHISAPIAIGSAQAGAGDGGVRVYGASQAANAVLSGGVEVSGWTQQLPDDLRQALPEKARTAVWISNLPPEAAALPNGGILGGHGFGHTNATAQQVELFVNDRRAQLARWPEDHQSAISMDTTGQGAVKFSEAPPGSLKNGDSVWLGGYWVAQWADAVERATFNGSSTVALSGDSRTGKIPLLGKRAFLTNNIALLDTPGEWIIDPHRGVVVYWPKNQDDLKHTVLSIAPNIFDLDGSHNVSINNISLIESRGNAIKGSLVSGVTVSDVKISNVGGWGMTLLGSDITISGVSVVQTGEGGISIGGGDRNKLVGANNKIQNSIFHDPGEIDQAYIPSINVYGVGTSLIDNVIYNTQHAAVVYNGNNHIIQRNLICNAVVNASDMGAIYTGRDWTARGTAVQDNLIMNIKGREPPGGMGLYLDDQVSGTIARGNVFVNTSTGVLLGGGRDHLIYNNVFIKTNTPLHMDARGIEPLGAGLKPILMGRLNDVPYQSDVWTSHYPAIKTILNGNPSEPAGNQFSANLIFSSGDLQVDSQSKPFLKTPDNQTKSLSGSIESELADQDVRKMAGEAAALYSKVKRDRELQTACQ